MADTEGAGSFSSLKMALTIGAFRPGSSAPNRFAAIDEQAAAYHSRFRSYQPDSQFVFFIDRLNLVNLYSNPTEIAKFTSVDVVCGG